MSSRRAFERRPLRNPPAASGAAPVVTSWAISASGLTAGKLAAAPLFALGSGGTVHTRASVATVQTTAATIDSTPGVDDACVFFDGTRRGIQLEEARTNSCLSSRDIPTVTANWVITAITITKDTAAGPDGTVLADRIPGTSGAVPVYQPVADASANCISQWARATAGTAQYQLRGGGGSAGQARAVGNAAITTTWGRYSVRLPGSFNPQYIVPCDGTDYSGFGGITAGARDCIVDCAQWEAGKFPTSFIFTTSAAITRAGTRLRHDTPATLIASGRLGLAIAHYPLGASTEYSANMRLWTIDASNYAEVNATTRVVTVVIGGVTATLGALPTWSALDLLEIWVAGGGGSSLTLAKARVNGGTVADLGTATAQGTVSPGANPIDFLSSGTSSVFSGLLSSLNTAQPAWA